MNMKKISLSPINSIIKDAKKGKIFILVDNKNRENEGDLSNTSIKSKFKSINFMAKHGQRTYLFGAYKKTS